MVEGGRVNPGATLTASWARTDYDEFDWTAFVYDPMEYFGREVDTGTVFLAKACRTATMPSAPRSLVATPGASSGQVKLTWLAPLSNGGAAITDYIVQRSTNATTGWTTLSDGVRATTGHTATGLTNGTRYYFRVLAKSAAGQLGILERRHRHPRPRRLLHVR